MRILIPAEGKIDVRRCNNSTSGGRWTRINLLLVVTNYQLHKWASSAFLLHLVAPCCRVINNPNPFVEMKFCITDAGLRLGTMRKNATQMGFIIWNGLDKKNSIQSQRYYRVRRMCCNVRRHIHYRWRMILHKDSFWGGVLKTNFALLQSNPQIPLYCLHVGGGGA